MVIQSISRGGEKKFMFLSPLFLLILKTHPDKRRSTFVRYRIVSTTTFVQHRNLFSDNSRIVARVRHRRFEIKHVFDIEDITDIESPNLRESAAHWANKKKLIPLWPIGPLRDRSTQNLIPSILSNSRMINIFSTRMQIGPIPDDSGFLKLFQ